MSDDQGERQRPERQTDGPEDDQRHEGVTFRGIADQLNGLGLRTPRGCKWYACTVRNVVGKNKVMKSA
jgi:hypothetical protein